MADNVKIEGKHATIYKNIPVAIDSKFDIYINNIYYTTLYMTPENIDEALIGLLYTDKLIKKTEDIKEIHIKEEKIEIDASVYREIKQIVYDECLSSKEIEKFVKDNGFRVKKTDILEIYRDFNKTTEKIREGLAIHTSGLYINKERKIIVRDVSRHVAILKLLGKVIAEGIDASRSILITSGRVSSDMVYRASLLNIPIILTLHGPLASGLAASILSGITLIANIKRTRERGVKILTNAFRILD